MNSSTSHVVTHVIILMATSEEGSVMKPIFWGRKLRHGMLSALPRAHPYRWQGWNRSPDSRVLEPSLPTDTPQPPVGTESCRETPVLATDTSAAFWTHIKDFLKVRESTASRTRLT